MSKRTKINFNTINGLDWGPLDVGDFGARLKEQQRLEQESKRKKEEEEKERINKIPCPVCKSTNKHHHTKYENNGIMGPGYSSWLVDEYLVCLQCGIHFSDLRKNELS
jgi:transposase-like protein